MKTSKPNTLKKRLNTKPTSNEAAESTCKRCGEPFDPGWIRAIKEWESEWSMHCELCFTRNIYDSLGLMTPPDLIDRHSKLPALTDAEFVRSFKK